MKENEIIRNSVETFSNFGWEKILDKLKQFEIKLLKMDKIKPSVV